jgi:hypothetical protein
MAKPEDVAGLGCLACGIAIFVLLFTGWSMEYPVVTAVAVIGMWVFMLYGIFSRGGGGGTGGPHSAPGVWDDINPDGE